ncbi:helix-turn-helix transcriptional regulator [Rhodobacter lacus]|uniref:Autoinducer binding domain-containing protein n=1 Tax=Rhodobacter lacus TaxID=1641972 RepID=A0ABW5ADC7_9RHOB
MSAAEHSHNAAFEREAAVLPQVADLRKTLIRAHDPFAAFGAFLAGHKVRGFHYLRLWRPGELLEPPPAHALFQHHTYPADWTKLIARTALFAQDPTLSVLRRHEQHAFWQTPEPLAPERAAHRRCAREIGLVSGVSLRLFSGHEGGAALGLWCATQPDAAGFSGYWRAAGPWLTQAAQIFDQVLREQRPNALIGLTPREIECLKGLLSGKRPGEICFALSLSERTFEKHICSAKTKLKARTRDQALAKAVLLNLLPR